MYYSNFIPPQYKPDGAVTVVPSVPITGAVADVVNGLYSTPGVPREALKSFSNTTLN